MRGKFGVCGKSDIYGTLIVVVEKRYPWDKRWGVGATTTSGLSEVEECGFIPIVEEQFFPCLDWSLGKDPDSMVSVDHHDFGVTVGIDRVVGKSDLVAFSCGIHHIICR